MNMEERNINYRGLLYLGMAIIALGIVLNNLELNESIGIVFISVGGLFLMISFKNKDKWDDANRINNEE